MRSRLSTAPLLSFFLTFLFLAVAPRAHAEFTIYSQLDDSGEMISQQATFQNTWISANLGNLFLGKEPLTLTFSLKAPSASNVYDQPGGVALGTCASCQDLQTYYFTDTEQTLLQDGAYHTFTVATGNTPFGVADGSIPIHITFFNLPQFHNSNRVKSDAAGATPYLIITTPTEPLPPPVPAPPAGAVPLYTQNDASGVMTNPQATFQHAYIDSASLGSVDLGQGELYLTFTMKSPSANLTFDQPELICLQPANVPDCSTRLQTYYFTDVDRELLRDGAFHTFVVKTGTTANTYADGTRPVSVGFFNLPQFQNQTAVKSNAAKTIPYFAIHAPPPADPCATTACASNVLFLPGIESSRLYKPDGQGDDQVWEPFGDDDAMHLLMNENGTTVRNDLYTRDVIDNAYYTPVKGNVYKSFLEELGEMKADGLINDYGVTPYDWRLALDNVLARGAVRENGRLYYAGPLGATSSPYIIQELRRLARSSQTGKVTVIAHSNGGLLAKALTDTLGAESSALIDKIIFVAVPQAGTPKAVGALLHGFEQALPIRPLSRHGITEATARELARNMPSVYNLLPSENYFTYVDEPVITISNDSLLAPWRAAYGSIIHSGERLHDFLTDPSREILPVSDPLALPLIGNEALLTSAEAVHNSQDAWTPSAGVELIEIAGWGMETLRTIEYYEGLKGTCTTFRQDKTCAGMSLSPVLMYKPLTVLDGDGTVVVPSALWTPGSQKYWVDLKSYRASGVSEFLLNRKHADILEIPNLRFFVQDLITNSDTSFLPEFVLPSAPSNPNLENRLHFTLHSPLTLDLYDEQGNHTGFSTTTDALEENVPGSSYFSFGEVQYISVPASSKLHLILEGIQDGSFTLDIEETEGSSVVGETSFSGIPSLADTRVTMDIPANTGLDGASPLQIDFQGDGTVDASVEPEDGIATLPLYRWEGFLQPIDDPVRQTGEGKSVFKAGSTIPVKFQLRSPVGTVVEATASPVWLPPKRGLILTAAVDEPVYTDSATTGSVYKWDESSQQYVYNWNTKGYAKGSWYEIYAQLDDGNTYSVTIGLK